MSFLSSIKDAFNKNRIKSTMLGAGGGLVTNAIAIAVFPPAVILAPVTLPLCAIGGSILAYMNNKPK